MYRYIYIYIYIYLEIYRYRYSLIYICRELYCIRLYYNIRGFHNDNEKNMIGFMFICFFGVFFLFFGF